MTAAELLRDLRDEYVVLPHVRDFHDEGDRYLVADGLDYVCGELGRILAALEQRQALA